MNASIEEIATRIINSGAVEVRDVDSGQEPFVYSTGNRGPGYIMIKGLVGQPELLKFLTRQLASEVVREAEFDFIEGNATGGMVPGWQLRNDVSAILGEEIPYCYLRESRKTGGQGELITGDGKNPFIKKGMSALIVEELVNYAGTTTNAADIFRSAGYPVTHGACILSYDHAESNQRLKEANVILVPLIRLPQLLDAGESTKLIPSNAVNSYRVFLQDQIKWQLDRGLVVPADTAKTAQTKGYHMRELSAEEAINLGAPKGKVLTKENQKGFVYWAQEK